jgi:hypothetical protein
MKKTTKCNALFGSLLVPMLSLPAFAEGGRQEAEIIVPEEAKAAYENWGYAPAVKVRGQLRRTLCARIQDGAELDRKST